MTYQGPPQPEQPGYGQPSQPGYGQPSQPGYGQPSQPGYGQPAPGPSPYGQPAPGQYGPPAGYPGQPGYAGGYAAPVSGPRVAVAWSGFALAIAGIVVGVGSFLDWAKFTAVTGETATVAGTDGSRDGKITVVIGALALILGLVIAARQGRIWVGIVGIVLAAIGAIVALADIGDISNKSKQASDAGLGKIDPSIGLWLVLVGSIVALAFSIVALAARRQRA